MSTEKPNTLTLPESTQISVTERGIEIVNEGDIVIYAKFPGASIRSLKGNVQVCSPSGEKQVLASVEAPNGVVKILGEDFEVMEIKAKEVFSDVRSLLTKVIRAEGAVMVNRGRLQANAISSHSLHFSGTDFTGQHIGVQEDAHFAGETVQVQVVTGTHIDFQLRSTLKISKLTAHQEAYLSAKSVDIDYLSAKSLRVTPQTQGVIVCLDGPAPAEPNSIVGMLSPATFLEKIPSLTGLIRELQSGQQQEKLLTGNITEVKTSEAFLEVKEKEKSALLEKPPEFYRTSAEIPIPYKELAAKQKAMQMQENKEEVAKEQSPATPTFEPDLSPSGPIFEPDLAPSTPLFVPPRVVEMPVFEPDLSPSAPLVEPPGVIEQLFEPNKVVKFEVEAEVESKAEVSKTENNQEKDLDIVAFTENSSPLDIPPLVKVEDPITSDTNPLNITSEGPIDLGIDVNNKEQ